MFARAPARPKPGHLFGDAAAEMIWRLLTRIFFALVSGRSVSGEIDRLLLEAEAMAHDAIWRAACRQVGNEEMADWTPEQRNAWMAEGEARQRAAAVRRYLAWRAAINRMRSLIGGRKFFSPIAPIRGAADVLQLDYG